MKSFFLLVLLIGSFSLPIACLAYITPDVSLTPGLLCTPDDPDFGKYDYPEHIARCERNVGVSKKLKIAAAYGDIPRSEWPNYEFDHLIPLCAGGSDDIENLWPQPIAEAHEKDVLENKVCQGMRAATVTQAEAIQKIHDWFNSLAIRHNSAPSYKTEIICKSQDTTTSVRFSIMGFKQISNITIALNSTNGEHDAIKVKNLVAGKELQRAKSYLLKDLIRYNLNEKSKDHFELFLPAKYTDEEAKFTAYLKIGFEGSYPNLSKIECE
ncbi:MAG: HNH endonuclease signature motif containing protein [Bacteriovorax sp.]|nr:HNH endonuclease signature motif containing protein [Bacteriovorax sp.]